MTLLLLAALGALRLVLPTPVAFVRELSGPVVVELLALSLLREVTS